MKRKLTAKQKKFANSYIESGNATKAAIDAGYSKKTAAVIGNENLIKPYIKSYIDERMKEIESNKIMDATEALQLLTSIARGKEKETVITATLDGVYKTQKEADLKTRISATKEILKRYPGSSKLVDAQIRKMTADANISEIKAKILATGDSDQSQMITDYLDKLEGALNDE